MNDKIEFCFVDIETTGLNAQKDVPLELGLAVVDADLNILDTAKWLIWETSDEFLAGVERGKQNEFVNAMHEKSGLWDDLAHYAKVRKTRTEVDWEAVEWLRTVGCPDEKAIPLTGSSIGSLDRPFVLEHFPSINGYLSYRNVDVSTVKELCKKWNSSLYQAMLPQIGTKEDSLHRVLDDIAASVNELNMYRENFFFQ